MSRLATLAISTLAAAFPSAVSAQIPQLCTDEPEWLGPGNIAPANRDLLDAQNLWAACQYIKAIYQEELKQTELLLRLSQPD
jgi:hypothetical protein